MHTKTKKKGERPSPWWGLRPQSSELSEMAPESRVIVQNVSKLCLTDEQLL